MNMPVEKLNLGSQVITLEKLALKNFKGIKSFSFNAMSQDINIFGDNATGKTTVYDAFLWLLFGKDSQNKKDFNIKTLDHRGEALHGLEHTVEATLVINGSSLTLKRTYFEKWVKKRGGAEQQFSGHDTKYWVNEVPLKAGEYQKQIGSLIDEDLFKLITNPLYFNTQLAWQNRRRLLQEMGGNISDEAVIASDPRLSRLTQILKGKSIDDYKKILSERIKKLNDEIAQIPIRVDELTATLVDEQVDYSATEDRLLQLKEYLAHIEDELLSASAISNEYRNKQIKLTQLYQQQNQKRTELSKAANAEHDKLLDVSMQLQRQINSLMADIEGSLGIIKTAEDMIADNDNRADELRKKWQEINSETFTAPDPHALTCPTCGQDLPAAQRESLIATAKENFEADKKLRCTNITAKGKALMDTNEKHREKVDSIRKDIDGKKIQLGAAEDKLVAVNNKLEAPRETLTIESHPEYQAIQNEIDALVAELQKPSEDVTAELLSKKREVTTEIEQLNAILNNKDIQEKTLARIEELKQEQKRLAQQINEYEGHRFMIETFIKQKVNLLEDSINSRFQAVRFKMFDVQINGGIDDCCEALVNTNGSWVPYADANSGGKINAGLDVINALTRHYGVSAPVFVDNRESVTKLIPSESQVISLIVSEPDKVLRTEAVR